MDAVKISQLVAQGARPRVPEGCPREYAALIKSCWQTEADERPTFAEVAAQLQLLEANARAYWPDLDKDKDNLDDLTDSPSEHSLLLGPDLA